MCHFIHAVALFGFVLNVSSSSISSSVAFVARTSNNNNRLEDFLSSTTQQNQLQLPNVDQYRKIRRNTASLFFGPTTSRETEISSSCSKVDVGTNGLDDDDDIDAILQVEDLSVIAHYNRKEEFLLLEEERKTISKREAKQEEQIKRRTVEGTASIHLPFSAEMAFHAFSNLTRQPSWSPWLKSVIYIDDDDDDAKLHQSNNGTTSMPSLSSLPSSLWTAQLIGISYSWKSVGTELIPPSSIGWKSISGISNFGRVTFEEELPCLSSSGLDDSIDGSSCRMTMTMTIVAPRPIAALFRRASGLQNLFQNQILMKCLKGFRDVVVKERS
eukprot:CAMPEP_0171293234 /NCGR_PEP_ID=MMETSP0816-20121228/1420_1 /TAXON_ID=420281 /ORGANISM="Proboscia inermis, Strain CCAP1064/1" /LENGTH=327 /DNA_ID=CAMNT_0011763859 /DNA_START=133 /DNA_END=1116 /DNA_ORIENTATION=-